MPPAYEAALSQIDDWPVPDPRVAIVGSSGILAARGPMTLVGPWASVSKLFTAFAVLMAVQDGELTLDDPAGPEGSTVRHLLAHASGLPFEGKVVVGRPGAKRVYSNTGFDLLGGIVADATGFTFDDYLRLQVLDPLGIDFGAIGRPAAGLTGSVAGLASFAQELLAPRLLDAALLAEATGVAFPGLSGIIPGIGRFDPNDWGLGFELRNHKAPHWTGTANSPQTFGHFGGSGSFLWVDPVHGLAMCGLTDRQFDDSDWAMVYWPPLFDAVLAEVG